MEKNLIEIRCRANSSDLDITLSETMENSTRRKQPFDEVEAARQIAVYNEAVRTILYVLFFILFLYIDPF